MTLNTITEILYHAAVIAEIMLAACLSAMILFCIIGAVDALRLWLRERSEMGRGEI